MAAAPNTTGNPEQGISAGNLFPLDAPEFAVRFRNGAKIFRHVFRRITVADWDAYHAAVIFEAADEGSDEKTRRQPRRCDPEDAELRVPCARDDVWQILRERNSIEALALDPVVRRDHAHDDLQQEQERHDDEVLHGGFL